MNFPYNKHNLFYRVCASVLIILHLVTFGPIRDAFAFTAQSASYNINSGALNEGGNSRNAASSKLWQDSIGEPCVGRIQSPSYILTSGYIATIQSNPPAQTQEIPYQSWVMNTSKNNAFDLDDYFTSPDGYALTFSVTGNSKINVAIDSTTHVVSFSQATDWFGIEKVYFTATDTEGNTFQSDEVVLQVENAIGLPNKPAIVDTQIMPSPAKEGDLITITIKAYDLDNQDLTFNYSDFFTETRHWKDGSFWYSEAIWQTGTHSTGHYTTRVTVTDPTTLTDIAPVIVNIGNFNHPPVLNDLPDITANEGELAIIVPHATDSDNDPIVFYYSAPFDTQGKWLTNYNNAGTYNIQVTASDGIDTVSKTAKIIINNTNRAPVVVLTLNKYTVKPDEIFNITISTTDPDNDPMTFSLKKDGAEIASGNIISTYSATTSFADLGDHNIAATVTDSGGKSNTDTKGVDVADPNANRDSINPVMGDFNGDAQTDLGLHNSDTGTWEICISDKGTFRNAVNWLTGFGTSKDWWPIGGDFNGDSETDAGIYNPGTGELKIALSNGSNFSVSGTWLNFPNASYSWQPFTGNFNGDKYTDFGLYNKDTGEVKIALSTGSSFGPLTTWVDNFGNDYIALAGDFNADGLSDLCLFKKSSGEFKVASSNSKAFVDGASWLSGFAADKDALISDFNNDGLTDVGYWDKTGGRWYYAISTGDRFVDSGLWLDNFGTSSDESATTGDFDGNGLTDAAVFDKDQLGINRWTVHLSTNKPTDFLTEINNGIGGKTQVTYTYAAEGDNPNLPFPVYVASAISLVNTFPADRAATYTQNFKFSGGYYDAGEREFRGFAKIKVTDPITNNYSETYFYQGKPGQDGALKGQIDKIIAYDGNARQISSTQNTYEVKKAGPQDRFLGFPALIETTTTVFEETAASITTKDEFVYDNIGNLLEQKNEGDTSKTGDEKSSSITYALAYAAGFNRPLETALKDKDGNIVSKKNFQYDSKGNLTYETTWLNTQDTQPYTQYVYDSFGNLTSTTNALGGTVITDYETDFYTFPEKVTNSLGQSIQYAYEPKFGAVKSTTDTNSNTSSTTYDTLGRAIQVKNAYNQVVTSYSYPDFNTKTTTNAISLFKTEYIDGLGRKYKTVSSGEDGVNQRNISSEVYFNSRGSTEKESLPHYVDDDSAQISYTRYEYDIRGRVKKTISDFPGSSADAESSINYLKPLYVETTDPMGHRKGTLKDAYGNILEVTEFTSGGVYKTQYEYDVQNNLIKTTDNQGNITQVFYDSLGRKIKMIDPDMGTWTYAYDLVGNLRKQVDAKGQILEFNYDSLNRLTDKFADGQTLVTYFYDDAAKDSCIGRLSKIIDQSGSTEFFYDKLGREIKSTKIIDVTSYTVERTYDVLDRLATLKYPDGEIVTYTYDVNSGLLEKVQGANVYVQDTTYSAKGQMKVIQYGNSTQTNYTYGQDLRLAQIYTQKTGSTVLQNLNYIFDKNGNVTTLTDNLKSNIRTFNYDDLNRLTEAYNVPAPGGGFSTFTYQYDSIGNMTYKSDVGVMSYGYNAGPHALTGAGGYTYQYDVNGNMTVGKNKTLAYDTENRLLEVNESGTITTFVYDGDGGRVKKTTSSGTTTYIGSLFEKDATGKTIKYIFAGANRVATVESTGSIYYTHSDHLGSSNVITDKNGSLAQYCEYTPYGMLARNEGTDVTKHKFTGKELDNTGLYFYGARYYDPEIGRFITADTIVQAPYNPQTLNRYSYCGNNPINYVDPTGHFWWFLPIIIGAIVGGAMAGITGGNIGFGILCGALSGAMFAGAAGIVTAMNLQGLAAAGVFAGAGAVSGAANAGITGGNVGIGALTGAIGGALGYGASTIGGPLGLVAGLAAGAVGGGVGSVLLGGDFGTGAWQGAAAAGIAYAASAVGNYVEGKSEAVKQEQQNKIADLQGMLDDAYAEGGTGELIKESQNIAVDLGKITVKSNREMPSSIKLTSDIISVGADVAGSKFGIPLLNALSVSVSAHSLAFEGSMSSFVFKAAGVIVAGAALLTASPFLAALGASMTIHGFILDYAPNPFYRRNGE